MLESVIRGTGLPVAQILEPLREALRKEAMAALEAPPGAGKTTLVPLALVDEPWLAGRSILMLEPRRLAARAAARRIAALLGEAPGGTVGYAMRFERRTGPRTRIEIVTEGLLTRRLQRDPGLGGVGIVVFDEFHERSLDADLGLVLCREVREALRPDLRLLVMSATLDKGMIAGTLDDAPVLRSAGRRFPVRTIYLPQPPDRPVELAMADAVRSALATTTGDILCFLPGAREIRAGIRRLGHIQGVAILPLMGEIGPTAQDAALRADPQGRRKVVLATNIAETSLTIEGVRVVIDGGLARRPAFSPRTGMNRLETVRISRASAEQRRGRAGRLGPGACFRLWSEAEDRVLRAFDLPEIATADLTGLALELASWGTADLSTLAWPTPPPAAAMARAAELLKAMRALDAEGRITAHGRAMAELPLHPRLAHMLLEASERGLGATAISLAAMLSARDPWRAAGELDLGHRLERWRGRGGSPDPAALAELERVRSQLARLVPVGRGEALPEAAGRVLAHAYPDRLAQARGARGRFRLAGGRGARLAPAHPLARAPFLAVAELDDTEADARIHAAAIVSEAELREAAEGAIEETTTVQLDEATGAVVRERATMLGALVLARHRSADVGPEDATRLLLAALRERGIGLLPWNPKAQRLRARLAFLHRRDPAAWPDMADTALLGRLETWLGPHLAGMRSLAELATLDLAQLLLDLVPWELRQGLDRLAPADLHTPAGSRRAIDYDADPPVAAVRLQELLGMAKHPAVLAGSVPLSLQLLSPAGRPIQVTADLPAFWRGSYVEVRKAMRGRYPKHDWPEDPLTARPTLRAKARA